MLNKSILLGRMIKDVEIKNTPSGKSVATFTIAVDRGYVKQGEERQADFPNCVAWGTTAEFIARNFSKGQLIAIVGHIQTRNYDDNDGKKVYITEVVVDEVSFAGDKKSTGETKPSVAPVATEGVPDADGFEVVPNGEDLPF